MPTCKSIKRLIPASCAWALLIVTTVLFFMFPCRRLQEQYHYSITIAQGVITFFVISNFFSTTFVDPGIIKRANPDEDKDDFRSPIYKEIQVKGHMIRMKWCPTCQFYRPPRCSHCSVCDNCIETFDHHCPWVNNCIGRRNYRHFFFFLIFLTLHMITIFIWCLLLVLNNRKNLSDAPVIIAICLMVLITIFFIPIVGLTGFHIVLVARGRTTNEQVTGKFQNQANPFSKGILYNCIYTLCGPRYPGLYASLSHTDAVAWNELDSNVVYMDTRPLDNQQMEDINFNPTENNSRDIRMERLDRREAEGSYLPEQVNVAMGHQMEGPKSSINGVPSEERHVVTMQQTHNGTTETTFIALPNNPVQSQPERSGIFPYAPMHTNKIAASPSKSSSISEITTHLRSPVKKQLSQGPEGGMVIFYSPDAGYISNHPKHDSETELRIDNELSSFDDISDDYKLMSSENYKYFQRPMPFKKALEISNKLEQNKQILSKPDNSSNRQSQYEMNYEISV